MTEGGLHNVMIFQLQRKVKQYATILKDNTLLGKLRAGDMIAKAAMHHSKCLLTLYRRSKQKSCVLDDNENYFEKQIQDQVLAELHVIWKKLQMKIKNIYLNFSILPTYIKLELEN